MPSLICYLRRTGATLFVCLLAAGSASGAKTKGEEVDRVALAAMLISDGHYDRAAAVLGEVDPQQKGIDLPRYYTLLGLVDLHNRSFAQALRRLRRANRAGQRDPILSLYAAQAYYGLANYQGCLEELQQNPKAMRAVSGAWLLRAQCYWRAGNRPMAWRALNRGQRAFPKHDVFMRHKIMLLIDMQLYQRAVELGRNYLARADTKAEDYISLAEALVQAKQYQEAAVLMEEAKLRFEGNDDVLVQLAQAYFKKRRPLSAAAVFEQAALLNPKYAGDAAELYRRGGNIQQALYLNMREPDQKKKLRQRMGLYIELDRFEEACGLEPRLRRLGLLNDEEVVYALAYSLFKTGRFERAEGYLKRMSSRERFQQASALREAMAKCGHSPWACE